MDSSSNKGKKDEILMDVSPLIRLYKNGHVERLPLLDPPPIHPSFDPETGVQSKDIQISVETGVKVRLFMPKINPQKHNHNIKIPLVLYIHGGGFCLESTFSKKYHNYLNQLSFKAQVMIVSVEHRRAPEHRLPAAYDDCWDALKWVLSYASTPSVPCSLPRLNKIRESCFAQSGRTIRDGESTSNTKSSSQAELEEEEEVWIREHVDFSRVYLMGDSSGGNIVHHIALRVGMEGLFCQIEGIILVHPYFWGEQRIGDEVNKCKRLHIPDLSNKMWALASPPSRRGLDDPWINPANEPRLDRLGCKRVLVMVAEKDSLRDRGVYYKEVLEKSGWKGKVEVVEFKGEDHVFHLLKPSSVNSVELMRRVVAFLNPNLCKL